MRCVFHLIASKYLLVIRFLFCFFVSLTSLPYVYAVHNYSTKLSVYKRLHTISVYWPRGSLNVLCAVGGLFFLRLPDTRTKPSCQNGGRCVCDRTHASLRTAGVEVCWSS